MGSSKLWCSLIIILSTPLAAVNSANILCLMGVACPSHHIWNRALMNALTEKGHNLTILSADLEENTNNTHYIHLDNLYPTYFEGGGESLDYNDISQAGLIGGIQEFYNFGILGCKGKHFLKSYPSDFKFDLIIHDFTIGPCLLGFLDLFKNTPLIGVTAFNNPPFTVQMVGGHKQYAYVPHYLLNYDSNMNLMQRGINAGLCLIDELYRRLVAYPKIEKSMREGFGRRFNLRELESRHRILLVNSHPAIDFPESMPPNIIPVGGLQISGSRKDLPEDISRFIKSSKKGTILFSIGSTFQGESLSDNILDVFLDAFTAMPEYNFLWKFETDKLNSRLPQNVMIKSWLPQTDILAHKRTRAFISHAGLLSTHEAFWYAVPIVAVPLFSDQHRNARKSVQAGVAVELDISRLRAMAITAAIRKVVDDKSYSSNMKMRSKLFRDQPELPLNRAIWWTEWVLRNPQGHEVLQTPVLEMGFLAANSIDLILLALLISILFCYISICLLIFFGRYFSNKSEIKIKRD